MNKHDKKSCFHVVFQDIVNKLLLVFFDKEPVGILFLRNNNL